jgi:tRNA pseudouridine55 synthase
MYEVQSSKGLYVRTLSYDIGKKLGYPAHNYELHRTIAGNFHVDNSYTLEEIKNNEYKLLTLEEALSDMQKVLIHDDFRHHINNGMAISLRYFKEHRQTKIIDENNKLLAIYDKHPTEPKMKAINIFHKE